MARQDQIGTHATSIYQSEGMTVVRYHRTEIVSFDLSHIILKTGGWFTSTTKTRMNQASNQFGLGYRVYQKDFQWYAKYQEKEIPFNGNSLVIER